MADEKSYWAFISSFLFSVFVFPLDYAGLFSVVPSCLCLFSLITHICFSLFESGFPRWLLPTPLFDVRASRQPPGKRVPLVFVPRSGRYGAGGKTWRHISQSGRVPPDRHYSIFEEALGDGPCFFGDDLTVLDIYIWMFSNWQDAAWLEANCPKIVRLANTVKVRPKIVPIEEENFGT